MATKTYNITFILIIVLILIILWAFMSAGRSYQYYNLAHNNFIEGATNISTEFKLTQSSILQDDIVLQKQWGLSFTVKLNKIVKDGRWHQIIGITPYSDARDARFFGAWTWPNSNYLHFRTATVSDSNDNIISQGFPLTEGKYYRFDVISNITESGDKQYISVTRTNLGIDGKTTEEQSRQIVYQPLNAPKFVSTKGSGLDLKPGQVNTEKIYMFTTYNNFPPIDGSLKDVVFANGLKDPILISNLTDEINKERAKVASIQSFTTMDAASREGLQNIGGIGNNGYIPGVTPPTNTLVNPPAAIGYDAILSKDGLSKICDKSIIQPSDPSFNWISKYQYNYPIEFNEDGTVKKSVPICSPDDLYTLQTIVLEELNNFNLYYSDYVTYKYNQRHSDPYDTAQKLKYKGGINDESATLRYSNLNDITQSSQYIKLNQDLQTYNNLLKANKAYYPNPENPNDPNTDLSNMDPILLAQNHKEIVDKRNILDTKLFELNNIQNSAAGESKMHMDSSIYVTLLWTTLATSIVYYMFTQ